MKEICDVVALPEILGYYGFTSDARVYVRPSI